MTDFVEECRREWKRLRVPAGPANEMADDLAADLRDAEADGAFPEEVLGDGAADPRAFAAAWARERGLVQPRWSDTLRIRRALFVGAGLVGLIAIGAAIGSLLSSSPDTQPPAVATGTVAFVSNVSGTATLHAGVVIGTSIASARLLPANIDLRPGMSLRRSIKRRPTSIRTIVHNSGAAVIEHVTLVVQVDGKTITRTVSHLLPNTARRVTVPLPPNLPAHFTIRVRTLPVPGERNNSNNHATWKISLRG
jgi:hypothetical protein